jgi:hypothetical protein
MSAEMTRTLIVLITLGNIAALIAGIALLVAPRRVVKTLGSQSAHPASLRRLTKPLEKFLDIEGPMLRYSRLLGVALLVSGTFVLIKWSMFILALKSVSSGAFVIARLFPTVGLPGLVWEILWLVVSATVLLGAMSAIFVGTLALVRTQALKRVSRVAGRWISTRKASRPVSKPYYGIDRWIAANPQGWGGAIALLSLYSLVMIIWLTR